METVRKQRWIQPLVGLIIAIAIMTAIFTNGINNVFGALSLIPQVFLCWYLTRFTRAEMGFVWGRFHYYGLALLQPAIVFSVVGLAAWFAGVINIQDIDWTAAVTKVVLTLVLITLLAMVTEEGFFRGWLWASIRRTGLNKNWVVALTGLAIAAWHVPVVFLDPEFKLPLAQVPVYLINIAVTGVIMGVLRLVSGSVIVPSISHGVWNAISYELFGTGTLVGLLGIQDSITFRPEVGLLGLAVNAMVAAGLWLWYRRKEMGAVSSQHLQYISTVPGPLDDAGVPRS